VVSDAGPGFDPLGRSRACASDAHRDCGHVSLAVRRQASPHRLESIVALCRCPCHAACPLAGRMPVSLTVWQQLCTCPGAEKQRAWKEDPDEPWPGAKEYREKEQRESWERSQARKQAFQAARDTAAGKTRDEIRDLYIAELRARGQEVPPEPFLGADIDLLTGHPLRGFRKIWKVMRNPFADL
jgi:hypothetical protein